MSFFRETLWSTQDGDFIIADQKIVAALIADPVFNPKSKSTVKKSMVKKATPTLSTLFTDNTEITHFEEFEKFPTTKISAQQFKGCTNFSSIVFPTGLTEIESSAFFNTSSLGSITFPSTLTTLGSQCFKYSGVKISEVPSTITSMEMTVFSNCPNIKTMNFNYAGTEVPHGTFENNSSLESVTIANNVTVIGPYAFDNCGALTTANISTGTTKIDEFAFRKCVNLSTINLPNTLTEIGNYAFRECTSINFTIPNSVTTIGNHAFDLSSLAPSSLPSSLTSLGFGAFGSCPTSITEIPSGLTEIKNNCLNSNTSYTITFPQSTKLTATQGDREYFKPFKEGTAILVNTQDLVDEYEADTTWKKGIDEQGYVFSIPGNIEFEDPNMETACVDKSSYIIDLNGDDKIAYWEALKCTDFGYKFRENTTIEKFNEFKYFTNITYVNKDYFNGCSSLQELEIPDTLTVIDHTGGDNFAFGTDIKSFDYKNLTQMGGKLPSATTDIYIHKPTYFSGWHGERMSGLQKIHLDNLNVWYYSTMENDASSPSGRSNTQLIVDDAVVTEISIPNDISTVQYLQYSRMPDIVNITIPSSVTNIRNNGFVLETATTSRTFTFENASNVTELGNWAFYNNRVSFPVSLFTNLTNVGQECFRFNTNLPTEITFNASSVYMGWGAFAGTNIEKVTINGSFSSNDCVFNSCTSLQEFNAPNWNPTIISSEIFTDDANLTTFNVDCSALETVGSKVFHNCTNLVLPFTEIPDTVTYMGSHAFSAINSVAFTKLPSGITKLDFGLFRGSPNVNISQVPAGVTDMYSGWAVGTAISAIEFLGTTMITAHAGSWGEGFKPFNNNTVITVATAALKAQYEADETWNQAITDYSYTIVAKS